MKRIARLSTGGELEITLPLIPAGDEFPAFWRLDQNGLLINLHQVISISGGKANTEKKLARLVDRGGTYWESEGGDFRYEGEDGAALRSREYIEGQYGPVREVWE